MGTARLRLLVLPRDANPYQRLLYDELAGLGVQICYLGELTGRRRLDLLLLPVELLARRARGWQAVHLHWVFAFSLRRGAGRRSRWLSQLWFRFFLCCVRISRTPLVWTAHNVLPHDPVFLDDRRARRWLVQTAGLVIVHSPAAATALGELGLVPSRVAVIAHGPLPLPAQPAWAAAARPEPTGTRVLRFAFVGNLAPYKGVHRLLRSFAEADLPAARMVIAGRCQDPRYRRRLRRLARRCGGRVRLRFGRLPERELGRLLARADVLVLPYRRITTSGTALLGLGAGLPVVVPDLPALADLPDGAVFRFRRDGTGPTLAEVLATVASTPPEVLLAMGRRGRQHTDLTSWASIARQTRDALATLVAAP